MIRGLIVFLLVAVGLSIFAFTQRDEALTQARIAFSRQLAAQALAELQKPLGNDEFAALLAIRSSRIQYDPIADAALVVAGDKLQLRVFGDHSDEIRSVAFLPDGRHVLTGGTDTTVKLWNVATGRELLTLRGHTAEVFSAVFSPDGKYVLTGSFDHTARLWEVDYRHFVEAVCARLLRDFTDEEREQAHITDQESTCPQAGR
jgi:WD40 repeat protein